jgi:hypothetical protein
MSKMQSSNLIVVFSKHRELQVAKEVVACPGQIHTP